MFAKGKGWVKERKEGLIGQDDKKEWTEEVGVETQQPANIHLTSSCLGCSGGSLWSREHWREAGTDHCPNCRLRRFWLVRNCQFRATFDQWEEGFLSLFLRLRCPQGKAEQTGDIPCGSSDRRWSSREVGRIPAGQTKGFNVPFLGSSPEHRV